MQVEEFIDIASELGLDGVELYSPTVIGWDNGRLEQLREYAGGRKISIAMLCHSPDFTNPDEVGRRAEVEREARAIEVTALLGGRYCRVLSGQDRDGLSRAEGVRLAAESIGSLIPVAEAHGVTMVLENHFKDDQWTRPEFARRADVFLELVDSIPASPWFGVNFDPSNAIVNGDDPIALLEAVKHRVVTMHASDRYVPGGLPADGTVEYSRLRHGVTGQGLNDYDAIFSILRSVNFGGWISIEDGMDPSRGIDDIRASATFLRTKMKEYGLP